MIAKPQSTTGTIPTPLQRAAMRKRRMLWLVAAVVFTPLMLLLAMQYWWLSDLRETATIARETSKQHYLNVVSRETGTIYALAAEAVLKVPPKVMLGDRDKLQKYLIWKTPQGGYKPVIDSWNEPYPEKESQNAWVASNHNPEKEKLEKMKMRPGWTQISQYFFALAFEGDHAHELFFFDSKLRIGLIQVEKDIAKRVHLATLYWTIMASKGFQGNFDHLAVDQQDPMHPLIMHPITDEEGRLVGITGLVINTEFFAQKCLDNVMDQTAGMLKSQKDWRISVHDPYGNLVLQKGNGDFGREERKASSSKFQFIFTDWQVSLSSRPSMLESWAGTTFYFNLALSIVLALALLGGILWALRTASRELEVSEMKSDFVSNVSHELRTPLASIRLFGELLRHGRVKSPEKIQEYGTYIENEGRRLSRLINNILDFSKIESGQKLYSFQETDLERVLMDVVHTFEVRLQNGEGKLTYQGPETPLPPLPIDTDAMRQVLFNLLDNSLKYGKDDHHVWVSLRKRDKDIEIAVKDNGIGIAREELEKIFERFHRVPTGLVHDVKGSGLGLSIVQHVVHAHQGEVKVKSEPGKGSTFLIRLPLPKQETQPAAGMPITSIKEEPT